LIFQPQFKRPAYAKSSILAWQVVQKKNRLPLPNGIFGIHDFALLFSFNSKAIKRKK
jgi:hypothetical protein